jgi:hypothetical protein
VTDLPPSCLSQQIERCTRRLRPKKDFPKRGSGGGKEIRIVQITPRGTHEYNRMQTYLYSTLYSAFLVRLSLSLSLSRRSLSLLSSLTLRHRPKPTTLSNPQNLEFDFHAPFRSLVLKFLSDIFPRKSPIRLFGESELWEIRKWRLRRRAPSTSKSSRMSSTRSAKSSSTTEGQERTFSRSFKE